MLKKIINMKRILLIIMLITIISCNKDDSTGTDISISLSFNQETAQDQMGDFADNTMTLFNDKIWSVAGVNTYTTPNYNHDLWSSDNGVSWVSTADNFLIGRHGTTISVFDNKLWVIGGENNDGNALQDIWNSDDGQNWTLITNTADFGDAIFHSTVVFNNKLYLIKGNRTTGKTEVWSSNNGIDWIQNTANAFSGRAGHKAVIFNNAIYVLGGEDIDNNRLNEIWKSTNGTDWEQISTNTIFSARGGHTATVYNNKVWVIAGRTDDALFNNDIWYTSNMQDWFKYDDVVPFIAIASHNTLNYNNALWLFGGYKSGGLSGAIWKIKEE